MKIINVFKTVLLFITIFSIHSSAQFMAPMPYWGGAQVFSLAASTLTVSSNALWVGEVINLTVSYKGRTGQVISFGSGHTVTISAVGAGTSVGTISAVTDNGNGTYSATLTGVTIGNAKNLTATIDGATLTSVLPTFTVTGKDCAALLAAGFNASQVYTVDVDGGGGATSSFSVYCDQTTDGGGWMLAAIPRRAVDSFAEPAGLLSPAGAGPGRNTSIWSATNSTILFTKLRLTNAVPATKTNIATFATSQTMNGLMVAYPTYSQNNVILSGPSITSNIGSTCFVIRGKSGNFLPYDDNSDWLFMGFISSCTTPISVGDRWDDGGGGATEWVIGGRDDGDGMLANHAVGINTGNADWEYSVGGTIIDNKTIVWIK